MNRDQAIETVKPGNAWTAIQNRIVLATPKHFSQIVNSNLEIRTSVCIDPTTGAAETGALFTYEAIPRTSWLWSEVVVDDYRRDFSVTIRKYSPPVKEGSSMQPEVRAAETGEWLAKAALDLRTAEFEFTADPPLTADIVFHCQQLAQKSMKGFLILNRQEKGKVYAGSRRIRPATVSKSRSKLKSSVCW